jgi:cobalamin-5''-phosphate synthase (EC 2.7.8.26)
VAAVFCTIATVLMTGGFHEDGLADVADGLGGSQDRERALDIMKDSRIGAFGAMALVLALLAKLCLLALLGAHSLQAALARWWAGMCCRGCGRCSSCAACRMWVTPPNPKASRWPTRSPGPR